MLHSVILNIGKKKRNVDKPDTSRLWAAYAWISSILTDLEIPFQIVGGFGVSIYGGRRPVADIDLFIPKQNASQILPVLAPFVSKPLKHYVEAGWDLEYLQLIYQRQKIEIGLSSNIKIWDAAKSQWKSLKVDFQRSQVMSVHGFNIPVMPKQQLIDYKVILDRDVDRIDVQDLKQV